MEISKRQLIFSHKNLKTNRISRILLACLLVITTLGPLVSFQPALAAVNPTVKVRIETPQKTVWSGSVEVKDCNITDTNGVDHALQSPKAACALAAAADVGGFTYSFSDSGWGLYLTEVDGFVGDSTNFWLYRVNHVSPPTGMADYDLADGDELLISLGPWPDTPLKLTTSKSSVVTGESFTLSSTYYDDNTQSFKPLADATVHLGNDVLTTDSQGQLTTSINQPGNYQAYIEKDGYVRSDRIQIEVADANSQAVQSELVVSNLGQVIWQGTVNVDTTQFTDTDGIAHNIDHPTALGALVEGSQSGGFPLGITSSAYGFYVSSINGIAAQGWDGWSYTVNGQSPFVGMADQAISDGDQIHVYYSLWPWKLEVNKNVAQVGEEVTFTAFQYDSGTSQWQEAPGVTVKIGSSEYQSDQNGEVKKVFDNPGEYEAYLVSGGWSNSPSAKVKVQLEPTGKSAVTQNELDQSATKALEYLKNQQGDDGSIENAGVSAWCAIAFGSAGIYPDTIKKQQSLTDFLLTYTPSGPNFASDYARQILASLACGRDPHTFGMDLIAGLKGCYQNNQIGDVAYINDDVFGVLALLASGEDVNSPIISDAIQYIVNHQNANGGFGYGTVGLSDVDTTSAVIQALVLAENKGYAGNSNIQTALDQAVIFLKNAQNEDGGFPYNTEGAFTDSDSASTAWVIQALIALGGDVNEWKSSDGSTPYHFLLSLQNQDGSFSWQEGNPGQAIMTAYVIPALEGQAWPVVLETKHASQTSQASGVSQTANSSGDRTTQTGQNDSNSSVLAYTGFNLLWMIVGMLLIFWGLKLNRFYIGRKL